MDDVLKYVPLNFGILRAWENWFLVAVIFVFLVLSTRLIHSDDNGILTPADNSAS